MFSYLKHYFTPKQKDLNELAAASWCEYIKDKNRIYNMDICQKYQSAFIQSYRHNYAKAQLAMTK